MDSASVDGAPVDGARAQALIAAYGAAPERWPAEERAALEAFLASGTPEASALEALCAQERALDTLLAAGPEPQPSAALKQAILRDAARELCAPAGDPLRDLSETGRRVWTRLQEAARSVAPGFGWLRPAPMFAASAILGLALGVAIPAGQQGGTAMASDEDIDWLGVAFDSPAPFATIDAWEEDRAGEDMGSTE